MKTIAVFEFMANLPAILTGVTQDGDIVRVESQDIGNFVVMEEAEYDILRDALKALIATAVSGSTDGKAIDSESLMKKLDNNHEKV
ncbi:MAG: hypothetical protein LBU26_03685 [Synergistaceae bacterium]|jgi:PHD/YefM family antitoxin component YafN of YafNO toxin-antitoxin module|nr:hypothetical protein [Synergistaceae bacterium]